MSRSIRSSVRGPGNRELGSTSDSCARFTVRALEPTPSCVATPAYRQQPQTCSRSQARTVTGFPGGVGKHPLRQTTAPNNCETGSMYVTDRQATATHSSLPVAEPSKRCIFSRGRGQIAFNCGSARTELIPVHVYTCRPKTCPLGIVNGELELPPTNSEDGSNALSKQGGHRLQQLQSLRKAKLPDSNGRQSREQ